MAFPLTVMASADREVVIAFYSEQFTLPYDPGMIMAGNVSIEEKSMVRFYQQMLRTDYQSFLSALEEKKQHLRLNDWLFFELLHQSVSEIFRTYSPTEQELVCWFFLSRHGFDTRLTFRDDEVFLYVYTLDEVFEVPMIKEQGRTYVNLTSVHHPPQQQQALYLLNYAARPDGRPFSFYLQELPALRPQPALNTFRFAYQEYVYQLDVQFDLTLIELMKNYPFIAERQYLEVPLSPTLAASLLPQLQRMLTGKTPQETMEFLVAFTRSAFEYKDDKEYFGRSKPMIADEVFHYPFSDCEDRSALLFQLVRQLLDLPMLIIAFDDHLTIAVALPKPCGQPVVFNHRNYYICDPTGPLNSSAIGQFPQGYEQAPFEVIGGFKY